MGIIYLSSAAAIRSRWRTEAFLESGPSLNRWYDIAFSLKIPRQWLGSSDLIPGNYMDICQECYNQADRRMVMTAQLTRKKKQHRRATGRVQLERKRFMEIDVDPGRDAEFGWIDKAEDSETERTDEMKGNRFERREQRGRSQS
jgi:hypothetical protein